MVTIFITNDPYRARVGEQAGADRIMVDLETRGKAERQGHLDTLISRHTVDDAKRLRAILKRATLMVRVNPMSEDSRDEVEACIAAGAEILMLPMITHPDEARRFAEIVAARAKVCLLLETGAALARLPDIIHIPGIDETHIGLNDLHLSLKLDFMFEVVTSGIAEYMARTIRHRGLRFGIGGIARIGRGLVSPELILSEHIRLGSSQVILSRDYHHIFDECGEERAAAAFLGEIKELHSCVRQMAQLSPDALAANSRKLKAAVDEIAAARRDGQRAPAAPKPFTA
jgi:2-keto-3-deoxy-L-rhamnonate aldolase RhmA